MNTIQIKGEKQPVFLLQTKNTSYLFRIDAYGHPEHIYYGIPVAIDDAGALALKRSVPYGDSIYYKKDDPRSCLDDAMLEWSGTGRGDYRPSPIELSKESGSTSDFTYAGYELTEETRIENGLPSACSSDQELVIHLTDETSQLALDLHYRTFYDTDVITRRTVLMNNSQHNLTIHKLMSLSLDMLDGDLFMMSFTGGWAHEMHQIERKVETGILVTGSTVGFSSSRTNPGFLLHHEDTTEENGECYGFNLIYSGNHFSSVSKDDHDNVRVMTGIQPENFHYCLRPGEVFSTPEAVMTYSNHGFHDLSSHFHSFVNHHIVRGIWQGRERPVLINDWEAFTFDFDEKKLLDLAEKGKKLGAELFVLDDGWFGERNNDRAGLGDYNVNRQKLPHGIEGLADRIHQMGMMFGLWFEPEAVNPDSDLYRMHPEWALDDAPYETVYGRNELLLDLAKKEVRDYIVESVGNVLDQGHVDYVKWDMNRQMTSGDNAYSFQYILGLYDCLHRIFDPRPDILLESCSSGGNRFDLGMLCFSPEIWASDDTDAIERLDIQKGYSYLYPNSCIGAHVSAVPNAQTMRMVPLHTRFHAALQGVLGYELDLNHLNETEQNEIKREIAFYKKHRSLFQYGELQRMETGDDQAGFVVSDGKEAAAVVFRKCVPAASAPEKLVVPHLKPGRYNVKAVRALMPVDENNLLYAKAAGTLNERNEVLTEEMEMKASDRALTAGLPLNNVFNGSGYNAHVRVPQDFGSELYLIEPCVK